MSPNVAARRNGKKVVRHPHRKPTLDGGEEDTPEGDHRPEYSQGDRRLRRRGPETTRHVQLRPVAVHRLADAVEHRKAGVHPEAARHRSASSGDRRSLGFHSQGQADAGEDECAEQDRRRQRKAPPEAKPDVDGDEQRGESRAEPEQCVQDEDRSLDRGRMKSGSQGVQRRNGEPKPAPRKAVATRRRETRPPRFRRIDSSGEAASSTGRRGDPRCRPPSCRGGVRSARPGERPRSPSRPGARTAVRTGSSTGRSRSGP